MKQPHYPQDSTSSCGTNSNNGGVFNFMIGKQPIVRQSLNGRGGEERHRHTSNLNANVQHSPPKVITDVINTEEDGLSGGIVVGGGAQQQSRNDSSNDADLFNGKKLNIP